jgi:hypothetical protein
MFVNSRGEGVFDLGHRLGLTVPPGLTRAFPSRALQGTSWDVINDDEGAWQPLPLEYSYVLCGLSLYATRARARIDSLAAAVYTRPYHETPAQTPLGTA